MNHAMKKETMSAAKFLKEIIDEVGANPLGGFIKNSDHDMGKFEDGVATKKIHFWDGQRFELTVIKLPDGCKYDLNTGEPIPVKKSRKLLKK